MGIKLEGKDQQLPTRRYHGKTEVDHRALEEALRSKVVAIDVAQWIFHAQNMARAQAHFSAADNDDFAMRKSIVSLITDRVIQLLRYGAHPVVVLDGKAPVEKAPTLAKRFNCHVSDVMICDSAKMVQLKGSIERVCEGMAIPCLRASSEGEALCAALTGSGAADIVWTSDIFDAFIFGANAVLRPVSDRNRNAAVLVYMSPWESQFTVADRGDLRTHLQVQANEGDVLLVACCIAGTDYNPDGLKQLGPVKAVESAHALHALYRSGELITESAGFLDFAARCLRAGTPEQASLLQHNKQQAIKMLVQRARQHCSEVPVSLGCCFADELASVAQVFLRVRREAERQAQPLARDALMWTGAVQHTALATALEGCGLVHQTKSGADEVWQKVMLVEAERMSRWGDRAGGYISVGEVKKAKLWRVSAGGRADGGEATASGSEQKEPHGFQYLVEIGIKEVPAGADESLREFVRFLTERKAKSDFPARVVRRCCLQQNWPRALAAYHARLADKGRKEAETAARKKSREAKAASKAHQMCLCAQPAQPAGKKGPSVLELLKRNASVARNRTDDANKRPEAKGSTLLSAREPSALLRQAGPSTVGPVTPSLTCGRRLARKEQQILWRSSPVAAPGSRSGDKGAATDACIAGAPLPFRDASTCAAPTFETASTQCGAATVSSTAAKMVIEILTSDEEGNESSCRSGHVAQTTSTPGDATSPRTPSKRSLTKAEMSPAKQHMLGAR